MKALVAVGLIGLAACGSKEDPGDRGIMHEPDLSRMIEVAASTFVMGHDVEPYGDYGQEWKKNELPPHNVSLGAFYIDRDEVTVAEYAQFLNETKDLDHYHSMMPLDVAGNTFVPTAGTADQPMRQVTWDDAEAYAQWVGKRLPTEAEWERAAKGDAEQQRFPWGNDNPTCARANFFPGSVFCSSGPQPVGGHSPLGDSPVGCRDMAGNVAEWTADWYGDYTADDAVDPKGPSFAMLRVVRGGGFLEAGDSIRTTARWGANPSDRSDAVGFRCVAQ